MTKKISGTKEWSTSSENVIDGCAHDCLYCYAKAQAVRFGRATPESWRKEKRRADVLEKKFGKRRGRIMFPTTHDITMDNVGDCSRVLCSMLEAGNEVLVVMKPDHHALLRLMLNVQRFPNEGRAQITFRFTIGSMDQRVLGFWEPGAPTFAERLYSLMFAYFNAWPTSVSVEPMLDPELDDVVKLYTTLEPYVTDTIWLGRMNQAAARLKLNGHPEALEHAERLCAFHDDESIRKLAKALGHPRPKLRWKESCKPALGIKPETKPGTDR